MRNRLATLAIAAALLAGASGAALAQGYSCPPGYVLTGPAYQPTCAPANPVGAAVGGAANAAGSIVGGAANVAGGVVGGAANVAGGVVGGTVGAVTGQPPAYGSSYPPPVSTCPAGYSLYQGYCYPAR